LQLPELRRVLGKDGGRDDWNARDRLVQKDLARTLRLIAELTPAETGNDEALLQRLAPFLLAGLKSPVPDLR